MLDSLRSAAATELRFRQARRSVTSFAELCQIRHPRHGIMQIGLYPAQVETLEAMESEDQLLILKARQIGFSTLMAIYVLWFVLFQEHKSVLILSKGERESIKLLAKVKLAYKFLPDWLRERGPTLVANTQQKMEWSNGSVVESLPSLSDPARGESASLVIVDEWAFLENAEDAWASIEPVTDIGGRIFGLSTANGAGTFFHSLWTGAESGANDFKSLFFGWWAVPSRDEAWYQTKVRSLQGWQLAQEYPSSAEEAFIKSGRPIFDLASLAAVVPESPITGDLVADHEASRTGTFIEDRDGALCVFEYPNAEHAYCVGADVAEGLEHGDYSVAQVIDHNTGKVVAKWRGHVEPDVFGDQILFRLGSWYNTALVGVEVNNHGLTTLIALRQAGYRKIYHRHVQDERTKKRTRKLGWRTQKNTKPLMIDQLQAALRTADGVEPELVLVDKDTVGELRSYVRDAAGRMNGSPFDDQVIALAIANQMRAHVWAKEYAQPADDRGTYGSVLRDLIGTPDAGKARAKIGAYSVRAS